MTERYTIADGDIMATGESCVWNYDVEPGDLGIPSNGDSCTIKHTCGMAAGSLSLASLTMEGEVEVSYSCLVITGGELAAAVLVMGEETGGFAITSGSLTLTKSTTFEGPSYATTLSYYIYQTGGTVTINANCKGGAAGAIGDPPESHGSGGSLVYKTGGTLVINGNCVGGEGASGTMNDEDYSDPGGNCIELSASSGTVTINGNCSLATGQDELSGRAVYGPLADVTINGNVSGGVLNQAVHLGTAVTSHVYGTLSGNNVGKFGLTGSLATEVGDVWAYCVPGGVTLDLSDLELANAGTFCVIAIGGTVTTTRAEVTNAEQAQFATVGCTIPTVNWPEGGGLTQQQVQDACAAALAAYDPPTKAEMDAATAAVSVATNNDKNGYNLTSAYDAAKTAAQAATALSNTDWTAARAAMLDNLGVGGPVASSAELSTLQMHGDAGWATADGFTVPGDAMTLVTDERAAIAKAVLSQDVVDVEDAANDHSLCYVVLAASQSTTNLAVGTLTVFKSDGTTPFAEKTIHSEAGAAPITGVS